MGFFSRFASKRSPKDQTAILAPLTGEVVALEQTSDPVFSGRAMGDGVAIRPTSGEVKAPVAGTVGAIFPTAHALAIETDDHTVQVMVHIGIDTVELQGKGFTAHVAQGDHVTAGQLLVSVDLDVVRTAGFDPTTFVVLCERPADKSLREHEAGPVSVGDELLCLS